MINIVLHEPEMPANTGNIGRTCVAAGARLHLIEPRRLHKPPKKHTSPRGGMRGGRRGVPPRAVLWRMAHTNDFIASL